MNFLKKEVTIKKSLGFVLFEAFFSSVLLAIIFFVAAKNNIFAPLANALTDASTSFVVHLTFIIWPVLLIIICMIEIGSFVIHLEEDKPKNKKITKK